MTGLLPRLCRRRAGDRCSAAVIGLLVGRRARRRWSAPAARRRARLSRRACCRRRAARLAADALAARPTQERRRRATPASGASSATASSAALRRRERERRARAHAPDAVPRGDRGLAQRRAAARRERPDRVVQLASPPITSASTRSATGASASPTWCARRPSSPTCRPGDFDEPVALPRPARPGLAVGADPPLRRRHEAGALAGHHRARARRRDAPRFRRQRVARDPHAADRAVGLSSRRCATCR